MQLLYVQKVKFSITDFFSKCDQIRRKLRIWSHLLKKSLMGNFIFCSVLFYLEEIILQICRGSYFEVSVNEKEEFIVSRMFRSQQKTA